MLDLVWGYMRCVTPGLEQLVWGEALLKMMGRPEWQDETEHQRCGEPVTSDACQDVRYGETTWA